MSRIVVIGGTGHVGTYMVPRLVKLGHDVIVVARNKRQPYQAHAAWQQVERVVIDRTEAEADGSFGQLISELDPAVVIDMICFTEDSARHLVDALRGKVQHFLHCGTIWVHGPSVEVPTKETQARTPFGDYGVNKAKIESYLLDEARRNGFPATILHPGHICGRGWTPINPAGNLNHAVYRKLARGEEVLLPNLGMETLHHVHADDVAQAFVQAMAHWSTSVGEAFHVVSPAAITLRGYAQAVASWFGQEAYLDFLPWDEWSEAQSEQDARATWDHIAHSPNCCIDKARTLIQYEPRYSSFQTVYEALMWLIENGELSID
jgi:nucleoside-diphosphate-sugar epimerase